MTDSLGGPSTVTATGKGVRTKLGCFTCRARKVKCDLTRPSCQTCTRLNLECTYVKPEGQMNIPRLRRGRKRRRSDPVEHQSSGSTTSWADRFGEEINGHASGSASGSGSGDFQQLRRASTNTMPELWRYQYESNLLPGGSGGSGDELASSAYLNSLMRRESMPVSLRSHAQTRGLGDILDPSVRTSSPSGYSSYPSSQSQLDQLRRSMTPSAPSHHQWQPAPSLGQTPEINAYQPHGNMTPSLPSISHTSSPLNWHTPQMPPAPTSTFDPMQGYPTTNGDIQPTPSHQPLPYLPNPTWTPHSSMATLPTNYRPISPFTPNMQDNLITPSYASTTGPAFINHLVNPTAAAVPQPARGRDDGLPPWPTYDSRQ